MGGGEGGCNRSAAGLHGLHGPPARMVTDGCVPTGHSSLASRPQQGSLEKKKKKQTSRGPPPPERAGHNLGRGRQAPAQPPGRPDRSRGRPPAGARRAKEDRAVRQIQIITPMHASPDERARSVCGGRRLELVLLLVLLPRVHLGDLAKDRGASTAAVRGDRRRRRPPEVEAAARGGLDRGRGSREGGDRVSPPTATPPTPRCSSKSSPRRPCSPSKRTSRASARRSPPWSGRRSSRGPCRRRGACAPASPRRSPPSPAGPAPPGGAAGRQRPARPAANAPAWESRRGVSGPGGGRGGSGCGVGGPGGLPNPPPDGLPGLPGLPAPQIRRSSTLASAPLGVPSAPRGPCGRAGGGGPGGGARTVFHQYFFLAPAAAPSSARAAATASSARQVAATPRRAMLLRELQKWRGKRSSRAQRERFLREN